MFTICGAGSMNAEAKTDKTDYSYEDRFFIGFSAVNLILSAALFAVGSGMIPYGIFGECAFLSATGLYCPGCGGTRALFSLAHGELLQALRYYPALVYYILFSTAFLVSNGVRIGGKLLCRKKILPSMRVRTVYFVLFLVIILGGWIVRNILWMIWGIPI